MQSILLTGAGLYIVVMIFFDNEDLIMISAYDENEQA
jgi:hypothetical protein